MLSLQGFVQTFRLLLLRSARCFLLVLLGFESSSNSTNRGDEVSAGVSLNFPLVVAKFAGCAPAADDTGLPAGPTVAIILMGEGQANPSQAPSFAPHGYRV